MSLHEIQRRSIAECVLLRPKMFTCSGSVQEILTLFLGYELAMQKSGDSIIDDSPKVALSWLDEKISNGKDRLNFPREFVRAAESLVISNESLLDDLLLFLESYWKEKS